MESPVLKGSQASNLNTNLKRMAKLFGGLALGGLALALALAALQTGQSTEPAPPSHPEQELEHEEEDTGQAVQEEDGITLLTVRGSEIAGLTHVGKARSANQDTFRVAALPELGPDYALLLVCDGMGGHAGGEVASEIAANLIAGAAVRQDSVDPQTLYESLAESLSRADAAIEQRASKERELAGMGTTAVAAIISLDEFLHCHLGDSRLYQIEGDEICYQTRDHSVVRYLVEEGIINEEEAKEHPYRSQLTSSLGGGKDSNRLTIEPRWDDERGPLRPWSKGQWMVLCSDGLNSELSDQEILEVVSTSANCKEAAHSLLEKTLQTDARDNVTIIVARCLQ